MNSKNNRNCTRSVVNNAKRKKMTIKNDEKDPKRFKSICGPICNVKTILNNDTLSSTTLNKLTPPFVKLERLNFEITGPVPLHKLPVPGTKNVVIRKPSRKKTKIKEKHKNLEFPSCSVKKTEQRNKRSTGQSPPKKDGKIKLCTFNSDIPLKLSHSGSTIPHIVKELNDISNQNRFKNVELCDSNENPTSLYNNNLCDINSSSLLFCDVNEIISSKTKDRNFFREDFKMKPITEISVCHCDGTCVPGILDVSLISDAFEFFKWHKKSNFPRICRNANNSPFNKISNSNQLHFEADSSCNKATLPSGVAEVEIPQSLVESSHETVTLELDLGAVTECNTTASNYTECCSIREISGSTIDTGSNSVLENPLKNIICSHNFRKKKKYKATALSMNEDPEFKKQHKAATLLLDEDADFSNDILDNLQNDNDLKLKICDIRGNCSKEVIQTMMEDSNQINVIINEMPVSDEDMNLPTVSNYEQDLFVEHESIKPFEQSCESLEKVHMIPKVIDSNQPLDILLNCNVSEANFLTLNEDNKKVFSKENSDTFCKDLQSSDKESCAIPTQPTFSITSEHNIQNNKFKLDMNLKDLAMESIICESMNAFEENISIVEDEFPLNDVENTTNDNSDFEQVSCTKPDEHNSNSRGIYGNDILADELDYEPSEASEIEISETESCNGEIEAKQNQSGSKTPMPDNTVAAYEMQSDSDKKVLRDSFIGQPVKDSVLKKSENELDQSANLYNTTENSFNKGSFESVQKNDTIENESAWNFPANSDDGCELQNNTSDSVVSEDVDTLQEKGFEGSNTEFDDIDNNEMHEGRNCISYLYDKEQRVNCFEEQLHENKAERLQKSAESEDDSESDSEHSFKRKITNDNQGNCIIGEENSVAELNQFKGNSYLTLDRVLHSIQEKCKKGKIDDAVRIANSYILISTESVQKEIFTELFFDIMDSFRDSDSPLMEDLCLDTLKNTMEIFYDLNLYDTELCSAIIIECLSVKFASPYGQELFAFCQKNNVSITTAAVMSCINSIKPSEMSLTELISFLTFLSKCKVRPPEAFLKEMWNLLFQDKEETSSSMVTEICALLYYIDSSEVDKDDLKKFVQLCIEKRLWTPVACLICPTVKKTSLIVCLIETIASCLEDIGFCYEELAKEMYNSAGSVPIQENTIFIQMGVCLLMEASSKKHYDSAFKVLLVFHRYNVNYLDYQAPMYSAVSYITSVPNPSKIFVFPCSVAFTALDVCLHLERPKDAFMIFQKLSLNLPDEFDATLKLGIHSQRFHYLLKITLALHPKDPLASGIKALRSLLSTTQTDFGLQQLSDYSKDIQAAYNKYMVSILNAQKEDLIKEFYSYTYGSQKELFTLDCQVLRGLTVFFVKHNMLEEANKLFLLGYAKNIYKFEKLAMKTPPWEMTVNRNWTSEEIKLTFLRFMETLTPFLVSKNRADNFDKWFSVKISIKNGVKVDGNVDCLNECTPILERICNVLKGLDSTLLWKLGQGQQSVHLIPETFYKFWFSRFSISSEPAKIFMVPGNVRISFGESSSQEGSESEAPNQFSDVGSSKGVDKCLASETCSEDRRLDENVHSDDSTYLTAHNVPAVPQNNLRNNRNSNELLVRDNISENIAYFSPQKTISGCSPARQNISPNNCVSTDIFYHDNASQSSAAGTYMSPKKILSSNSFTPQRIQNHIPSSSTSSPKSVSTSPSPKKSFLRSPNAIVSPHVQEKFSPITTVNISNDMTASGTTFENVDQNYSMRNGLNFDNFKISTQTNTTASTLSKPDLKNSAHRISPGTSLNRNSETVKPETVLKSHKKAVLTKKRHSANCLKYKKNGSAILKSKTKIAELKSMKIILQNTSVQGEAQRIVKPVSGVTPQTEIVDSQEPSFQHNVPEDVFLKITNFLKSKVMVKRKDLTAGQQQQKALSLAHSFIQRNVVTSLDKRTMKLLNDYSDECL